MYLAGASVRRNAAVFMAIAVKEDGYRKVLGAAGGMKEDKASWVTSIYTTDMRKIV